MDVIVGHERREDMYKKVKQLRKALGLTLEKFGEKPGVGKNAISRIETGKSGGKVISFTRKCLERDI